MAQTRTKLVRQRDAFGRVTTRRVRVALSGLGDIDSATADATLKATLLGTPAQFAIAYLDRNGQIAKVDTFATRTAMLTTWDAMVDGNAIPSSIAEIAWLDKSDQDYDGTTSGGGWNLAPNPMIGTFTFSKINWRKLAPWIVGGAVLIAGAIYWKKKPARGRARRRSSWRRRTITVWR